MYACTTCKGDKRDGVFGELLGIGFGLGMGLASGITGSFFFGDAPGRFHITALALV
jgi:hypothetical protein